MNTEKQKHMTDCSTSERSKPIQEAVQRKHRVECPISERNLPIQEEQHRKSTVQCLVSERSTPIKRSKHKASRLHCSIQDEDLTICPDESENQGYPLAKKNRREVQARQWKAQQERTRKKRASNAPQQLRKFLLSWLQVRQPGLSQATYQAYQTCLSRHVFPLLGHLSLRDATDTEIETCLREVPSRQLPLVEKILSEAFTDAVAWRRMTVLPSKDMERSSPESQQGGLLTDEQMQRLLEVARSFHLDAFLLLAITTGLRRGELFALRWYQIDWKGRNLRREHGSIVCPAKRDVDSEGHRLLSAPVEQIFPLSANVIAALEQHQASQEQMRQQAGNAWHDLGLVFPNAVGNFLAAAAFHRLFQQMLQCAGLPTHLRLHDLRERSKEETSHD